LKATDWVALYPVKIRRTVRVDIRETGSFQKTTGGRRVPFTVRKTAYRRATLYLLKIRRVAQGALVEGKNELRDHHSRLNKGPIVGWNDGSQKFRALQPVFLREDAIRAPACSEILAPY
jgi:hypothetical protein